MEMDSCFGKSVIPCLMLLPGRHFIIACGSIHHSHEWNGRLKERMVCGFVLVSSLSIMLLCGVSLTTLQGRGIFINIYRYFTDLSIRMSGLPIQGMSCRPSCCS